MPQANLVGNLTILKLSRGLLICSLCLEPSNAYRTRERFTIGDSAMKRSNLLHGTIILAALAGMAELSLAQVVTPRQERRIERQEQRLNNRSQYYNSQAWSQLNPWITRNQVPAATRAVQAATAVANTAANAAAAVNAAGRYGYATGGNPSSQTGWFYDYYSYSPTYYSTSSSDSPAYASAVRYQDIDGDGVYDSVANFSDSSKSGKFDAYDRYDFAEIDQNNDKNNDGFPDSPVDSSRYTVSGKIETTKIAKVNGVESLVVKVALASASPNTPTIVDLGATTQWQSTSVKANDTLTATGPIEQIGDKTVMIAESVTVGQAKPITITRLSPTIKGEVVDVTQTQVKGMEHTLVVVNNGSDRQIVDLGPTSALKFTVAPQTKLSVRGVPVQVRDHKIIMADFIDLNGQQINIQRW